MPGYDSIFYHISYLLPIYLPIRLTTLEDMQVLDSLSERIVSLAFDVISRVMETGPVSVCFLVLHQYFCFIFPL